MVAGGRVDIHDEVFRDYVLTTVFHQRLSEVGDVSATRIDELIVLHSRVNQLVEERNARG